MLAAWTSAADCLFTDVLLRRWSITEMAISGEVDPNTEKHDE
jgi:hypothetical protein